ncbi:type IA DNA topoisomerase [Paenibacillus prosopidis]|uniref:DNA topoisomerase n=1 Tax=Paenibacillus prosopidis TaxID=630520 RepID=A0A368VJS5_9BACL|nr:type IA DNA topoisomerase [Paenibacillus prosopidis]RCW41578.1 DNA topoisomerase-3 [Paenibacillus prosopidis]
MYNRVILAEKPAMGTDIAQALELKSKGRHYHTLTNGDVVTWAIGHVIQLKEPDSYPEYKEWKLENLPFIPDPVLTEVDPDKKDQVSAIRELVSKAKCVVIATDAGREGEHIARLVLQECKYPVNESGRAFRLWLSDLTPETIQKAYANMKDARQYENLAASAQVRANADFWMGITATRFFSVMVHDIARERVTLSAGRVQTPTLRIVYDREMAIQNFVAQPFYVLVSDFQTSSGNYPGQWFKLNEEGKTVYRFDTKDKADEIRKKVQGQQGSVLQYTEKSVKRYAPQLLHEGSIKTEARKQLGFSLQKTKKVLQAVYDKKYCTYPRTDSRHMSENAADELLEKLTKLKETSKYQQYFPNILESIKGKTRFVDNKKVTEHHAIVPTDRNPEHYKDGEDKKLTTDEEKLYELILRHTLAAFHPEGVDKETEVITSVVGESFYSKAVMVVSEGWRKILKPQQDSDESSEDESKADQMGNVQKIPQLQEGQAATAANIDTHTGKTSKPKRMYDSDLQEAMEHAGRHVDAETTDEEVKQFLKSGIGTPATRSDIIETLKRQKYIEIEKNLVYLTDKGKHFMELIYEHPLASIELTGEFEKKLNEVAEGQRSATALLEEFKAFAHDILSMKGKLQVQIEAMQKDNIKLSLFSNIEEVGTCPICGKPVIEGSKGYGCSAWKEGCKFTIWKEHRNVKLREKQVRDLLEGKEILVKDILPSQDGKKPYDVYLKLKDGKLESRFPTIEDNSLGDCPVCGKPVVEKDKNFGCSGFKDGCKFAIWKEFRKVELPRKAIKPLLAGKEVLLQNIQPSETGKKAYDVYIFLKDGHLQTRFPIADDNSVGACPLCSKPVVESDSYYGCSAWRQSGCRFKLSKEFLGVIITPAQFKKLMKNGKTDKLIGFKSSKGLFDTALGYDQNLNRYSFMK